jgi:hypothetical protein
MLGKIKQSVVLWAQASPLTCLVSEMMQSCKCLTHVRKDFKQSVVLCTTNLPSYICSYWNDAVMQVFNTC